MQWQKAKLVTGSLKPGNEHIERKTFWVRAQPPETIDVFLRDRGLPGIMENAYYSNLYEDGSLGSVIFPAESVELLNEFTDDPPFINRKDFDRK